MSEQPQGVSSEEAQRISTLATIVIEDRGTNGAANIADSLTGGPWNVRATEFGWRAEARDYAQGLGLVEAGGDQDLYMVFTKTGRAVREELHKRGVTLKIHPICPNPAVVVV